MTWTIDWLALNIQLFLKEYCFFKKVIFRSRICFGIQFERYLLTDWNVFRSCVLIVNKISTGSNVAKDKAMFLIVLDPSHSLRPYRSTWFYCGRQLACNRYPYIFVRVNKQWTLLSDEMNCVWTVNTDRIKYIYADVQWLSHNNNIKNKQ